MGLSRRQSRTIAFLLLLSFFVGTAILIGWRNKQSETSIPQSTSSDSHTESQSISPTGPGTPGVSQQIAPVAGSSSSESFAVDLTNPSGAQMVLKNFKRNVSKDGKVRWKIVADEGRYRPADGGAELINATFVTAQKDGTTSTLTAKRGILFTSGQDLEKADLSDGVTVQHDDFNLKTEKAVYEEKQQKVFINTPVKITTAKIDATADSMTMDLARNVAVLVGNVITIVKPDPTTRKKQ